MLLVSGEPHPGERTWRNLLKSDANVDLVHFTILRPPEKQDGTPINELSLIAFPTRELFQQKIKDFDLIIFDRYANQSVLPSTYFDNIARYVREGGALLIAAGPEFAGPGEPRPHAPRRRSCPASRTGASSRSPSRPTHHAAAASATRSPATCRARRPTPPAWGEWLRTVGAPTSGRGTTRDGGRRRPAAARARARGQGPRRAAPLRPRLALGARLPGRRPACRPAAPPRPLADEGAGAGGGGAAGRRAARPRDPGRAPDHGPDPGPSRDVSPSRAARAHARPRPRSGRACSRGQSRAPASSACTRSARATSSPSPASARPTRASSPTCSPTPSGCARSPRRRAARCAASRRDGSARRCRASRRSAAGSRSPGADWIGLRPERERDRARRVGLPAGARPRGPRRCWSARCCSPGSSRAGGPRPPAAEPPPETRESRDPSRDRGSRRDNRLGRALARPAPPQRIRPPGRRSAIARCCCSIGSAWTAKLRIAASPPAWL